MDFSSPFRIVSKQILAEDIKRLDVFAPEIARCVQPGQFVMVTVDEVSERIPLAVVDHDVARRTISLIFHEAGPSTRALGSLQIDDEILSVLGPLGVPSQAKNSGVVVCIATGVGAAQILPIARSCKHNENKVIGIIGAKTKRSLMLEPQIRLACHKIFITTNDGSYERRGLATEVLGSVLEKEKVDMVYAIGSVDMMEAVCQITRKKRVKTRVHLNPVMLDGIGLCGSCRVKVDGQEKLACTDGPEFDGHKVDFQDLRMRMNAFEVPDQWNKGKSLFSRKISESQTLTKFLSAIIGNKP